MRAFSTIAVACALVSATVAAFAPSPVLGRSAVVRTMPTGSPLRPLRQQPALLPLPPLTVRHSAVVATASAAARPLPSFGRSFVRVALACVTATLALLVSSARLALAAERTMRRAAPAAGVAISGDVVKYGFVGACVAASYFMRREETPILRETPGAATLDVDTLAAPPPPAEAPAAANAPAAAADALPDAAPIVDDSALFSSLQARMQSLADGADDDDGADGADAPPPADSSDSWGTGSTAVLEPPSETPDEPKAGVLDGEPNLSFPPGFPLVDGDVVEIDNTPSASADQIAMFNRMMGKAE